MTTGMRPPEILPLFPLGSAILLPGEVLPLNVFEPRYLNMLDDIRSGGMHIGIVQPMPGGDPAAPALKSVGGAGKLTGFRETEDGRYLITLEGVCRFRLVEELACDTPYRVARADYAAFGDLDRETQAFVADRTRLVALLQAWLAQEGVDADWEAVGQAPLANVVDRLAMAAPFCSSEKQSLLEAPDVSARYERMQDIIAERLADSAGGPPQ